MRVVHITAGAGGRICGSCLHDNALVKALVARGAVQVDGRIETRKTCKIRAGQDVVVGPLLIRVEAARASRSNAVDGVL